MQPKSTTHEHLLSVIVSESARFANGPVRVLDAGCGSGDLMDWLRFKLPQLRPGIQWEVHGFDVSDHGSLEKPEAGASHIKHVSISDPWPYPDGFFDVAISNQVMEHVAEPRAFLSEAHRVLRTGGFSAHLFPLKHYVWEGHLHLPFVHRIRNADLRTSYVRGLSRLGLGRFPDHHKALGIELPGFSQQHADFIAFFTRYMSYREALDLATGCGFRASFRYTRDYYTRKVKKILRRPPTYEYPSRSALGDWVSVMVLRYVAGVTLFLEKGNTYTHGTEERVAAGLGRS